MSDSASRSFHLHQTLATRMLTFMPVMMFGTGLVAGIALLLMHGFVMPGVVIGPIWLAVIGFISAQYLSLVHTIEWSADGTLTFRSHLSRTSLRPDNILSIEPVRGTIGMLQLRHSSGKLRLLNQFDGFYQFLARLKASNPVVRLIGC